MSPQDLELLPWLAGLVHRRDEHGRLRYSRREVEDFLAALLLEIGLQKRHLSARLTGLLVDFAKRAGIRAGANGSETEETLRAYFRDHPVPKDLLIEFRKLYRESLIDAHAERSRRAFRLLLGAREQRVF